MPEMGAKLTDVAAAGGADAAVELLACLDAARGEPCAGPRDCCLLWDELEAACELCL